MKIILGLLTAAFLFLVAYSRYETEILGFIHKTPQGTLAIGGLITLMLLAELSKKKPKKKED